MAIGLNIAVAITAALALTAQPTDVPNPDSVNPPRAPIMVDLPAAGDTGQHCSVDMGLCFAILNGDEGASGPPQLQLRDPHPSGGADGLATLPLPQSLAPQDRQSLSLWTRAIRLPGNPEEGEGNQSVLIGILFQQSTMYSGGGGAAQRLHLFRLRLGNSPPRLDTELLSLPWTGSLLIRACFGEADSERRRGVCHDDYNFGANLSLAPGDTYADDLPQLAYATQATSYPQTARRGEDSSAAPPLRASDLSRWRDPECSYTRTLRFNPASERYEMERSAPDCSIYTVP